MKRLYTLVEVVWEDCTALEDGWTNRDENIRPALVLSVGFLVQETKSHLIIAQDIDEDGYKNGRSQIPRGMVKRMTILKRKDASG